MILAAILVVIGGFFWLTRSDSTPERVAPTPANEPPDFSLTDAEAIARAEQLELLVLQAYRQRDIALLGQIYAADSELLRKTERELAYLKRRNITANPHYKLLEMSVVENSPSQIVIKERSEFDARFIDEEGNDVTGSGKRELQKTLLTLHRELDQWLIFDSVIVKAEPLN